jgi:hypothetical protein
VKQVAALKSEKESLLAQLAESNKPANGNGSKVVTRETVSTDGTTPPAAKVALYWKPTARISTKSFRLKDFASKVISPEELEPLVSIPPFSSGNKYFYFKNLARKITTQMLRDVTCA